MEGFGLNPGLALHVGCGGDPLPDWLEGWRELRLDISPDHAPDILASMTDIGDVEPVDAVVCCHSLEHIRGHEVPVALSEFFRVLKPRGFVFIIVPDCEDAKPTDEVLFDSPAGPITGLDLFYGKQDLVATMPFMVHHTAFTAETLGKALERAGFGPVQVRRISHYNLIGVGVKP